MPHTQIVLEMQANGDITVLGTGLRYENVVAALGRGVTHEDIAQKYPEMSDVIVDQIIGHYLDHATDLDGYFERRKRHLC